MWNSMDDGGFGKSRFDQQSGGGFLNTSAINSPSTSDKKKPDRITNVVPCTIAQIHSMPESDDSLKIGSLSAKIITFVGFVKSADIQTTKITYIVTDHTGPAIEVQMWLGETDEQKKKVDEIPEESYARVTGAVRSMKGKRHVIAFNVQPIQHLNELTMHIAEVIHTSMSVAVMDKQSATSGLGSSSMMTSGTTESAMDTFDAGNSRKLTKPQQLVKQAIINCKDEQGINVMELYNSLKSLSRQSIQEALDFLSNEGHIYSTIDEDHFKSTDCV
ncbi:replication protein A 32 kDa subunit-A-like [Argiope bruennichi]|uniref:Replication protein A 32 kDa subunit like protein n=1 Tax=Argiope bruennichi TaxID=94029 RepID=A0A8T0EZ80_ARGBR|nr:replication protein A 32 kDa subunit-A-like [Argiope bruennichi]KAF8783370.1 Replication protein A 32 kDa subunit like protein [Argiope bruennichi]